MEERLSTILEPYRGKPNALIPILQEVQEELGYLPEEAMLEIAKTTGLPESQVYGVATFYAQFYFSRRGKNQTKVCSGTACHVKGAARVLDAWRRWPVSVPVRWRRWWSSTIMSTARYRPAPSVKF
jgi:NADH-quinone oxidoreductase subunit E